MTFLLALSVFLCGAILELPTLLTCVLQSSGGIHLVTFAGAAPKPAKKQPKPKPPKNVEKVKQTFTDWKAST